VDANQLLNTDLAGFRLTKLIGEGGMALVFRGENLLNPKIVRAIKVVRPELAGRPEFAKRFAEEALILENLSHPNVVKFYGLRTDRRGTDLLLVMELELLAGEALSSVMRQSTNPPALRDAVTWLLRATDGVAAAHALGIVHRDIKPDNLFLTTAGDVKVLDFGIARALDEVDRRTKLTAVGTVPGTVAYMAPEVCNGGEPGAAADVYALGISLVEMLFGYHPFAAPGAAFKSSTQLMFAHVNHPLTKLRSVRRDAPPQLEAVVERATAKDPAQRYATARELAEALRGVAATLPGVAGSAALAIHTEFAVPQISQPQSTTSAVQISRATRPIRPMLFAAAGIAGVLALGAGSAALWSAARTPSSTATPGDPPTVASPADGVTAAPTLDDTQWVRITPASGWVAGVSSDRTPIEVRGFRPSRALTAPTRAFEIQRSEVRWAQLDPWLARNSGQHFAPPTSAPADPTERASLAASSVPWDTARLYCRSIGGSLPTEEQWEYAARGKERRPFPWGAQPIDLFRTRVFGGVSAMVGAPGESDQDMTPEGIVDMLGNAQEWTIDLYRDDLPGQDESWVQSGGLTFRAIRGLPYREVRAASLPAEATAWRDALCATGPCDASTAQVLQHVGFRCVRAVEEASLISTSPSAAMAAAPVSPTCVGRWIWPGGRITVTSPQDNRCGSVSENGESTQLRRCVLEGNRLRATTYDGEVTISLTCEADSARGRYADESINARRAE